MRYDARMVHKESDKAMTKRMNGDYQKGKLDE